MSGTDWLTASGILLAGAIVGFMFFYATASRKKAVASTRALEIRDLEAKRDALIGQLRELDDTGGSPEERARVEQEAALVLRKLDGAAPGRAAGRDSAAKASAAKPAAPRSSSALQGFLWGAGSAAALAGLIFFVISSSKSRSQGESPVGGGPPMASAQPQPAQQQQPQSDPELQKLEAAVKASPNDLSVRDDLAKAYLNRENMMAAFEQAKNVLDKAPNDARALTVQAIVLVAMGSTEQATRQLEKAAQIDPSLSDAWVALAWAYTMNGRDADAGKAIDSAVRLHPDQEGRLRDVLAKMREQAKRPASQPASQQSEPMASARPEQAAAGGPSVQVTISVAPGATIPASHILFVIVRAEGQTGGPPAAVKRLAVTSLPMTIEMTAADSMLGQPLPARMRIEARLDSDGVATTKDPTDLTGVQDGVVAGGKVALVLK